MIHKLHEEPLIGLKILVDPGIVKLFLIVTMFDIVQVLILFDTAKQCIHKDTDTVIRDIRDIHLVPLAGVLQMVNIRLKVRRHPKLGLFTPRGFHIPSRGTGGWGRRSVVSRVRRYPGGVVGGDGVARRRRARERKGLVPGSQAGLGPIREIQVRENLGEGPILNMVDFIGGLLGKLRGDRFRGGEHQGKTEVDMTGRGGGGKKGGSMEEVIQDTEAVTKRELTGGDPTVEENILDDEK